MKPKPRGAGSTTKLLIRGELTLKNWKAGKSAGRRFGCGRGEEILQIRDEEKTCEVIELLLEEERDDTKQGGWRFWISYHLRAPQTAMPFTVDLQAEELKQQFEFQIEKRTETQIWLSARPITRALQESYKEIKILLDAETYRTYAVKVIAPSEKQDTVYVFREVRINGPVADADELLRPRLEGYEFFGESKVVDDLRKRFAPGELR